MDNQNIKSNPEINKLDAAIAEAKRLQTVLMEEKKPLESIYKWTAPERVFEPKERSWYVIVAFIAMIIIVYSAFTQNFLLIFVMICLILLTYSLNTIPPKDATHEITNRGLHVYGDLITWEKIKAFWITKRKDKLLFNFEIQDKPTLNPRKLIILVGQGDVTKITSYIIQFVDYFTASEAGINFFTKYLEGEHQSLIKFLESDNILTKDPKDAPILLKRAEEASRK
jgi:hypothetical protein